MGLKRRFGCSLSYLYSGYNIYLIDMQKAISSGEHKTKWITISMDEYESMKATIEVMCDKDMVRQLIGSNRDMELGRVRKWDKFVGEYAK
jgi:hypothetical protein